MPDQTNDVPNTEPTPTEITPPIPEQAPMDDDAGGPTVSPPEEDEATKLGDFA